MSTMMPDKLIFSRNLNSQTNNVFIVMKLIALAAGRSGV